MNLAKAAAANSGYIVEPQDNGTYSDDLKNKPAVVKKDLHGDTPLGLPKRSRPQKRASLAKEAASSAGSSISEWGYGGRPGREHESWRPGTNRGRKKTVDQEAVEIAFFEGLRGEVHPKRRRALKRRARAERAQNMDTGSFTRTVSPENVVGGKGNGL